MVAVGDIYKRKNQRHMDANYILVTWVEHMTFGGMFFDTLAQAEETLNSINTYKGSIKHNANTGCELYGTIFWWDLTKNYANKAQEAVSEPKVNLWEL